MLPSKNVAVSLIKILYTANLVCSYPITIKPTNEIIERYLFKRSSSQSTVAPFAFYGSRISRSLVVISAAVIGIVLAKDMDKFLGFFGALLGSPMAMTFPALIHYKLVATSSWEKVLDVLIMLLSLFTLIFSTLLSL